MNGFPSHGCVLTAFRVILTKFVLSRAPDSYGEAGEFSSHSLADFTKGIRYRFLHEHYHFCKSCVIPRSYKYVCIVHEGLDFCGVREEFETEPVGVASPGPASESIYMLTCGTQMFAVFFKSSLSLPGSRDSHTA